MQRKEGLSRALPSRLCVIPKLSFLENRLSSPLGLKAEFSKAQRQRVPTLPLQKIDL